MFNDEQMGNEPEKPKHLTDEQEAGLRGLAPSEEPKGDETKKEPDKETVVLVAGLYMGIFGVAAARLGEHWALTGAEASNLSMATVAVLDKYLPGFKVGVEVTLLAAIAMTVVPRLMVSLQKPIEGEVEKNGDKSEHQQA